MTVTAFVFIIQLAARPTPIHQWSLGGVSEGVEISVKRDDMTGSVLSGNKVLWFCCQDTILDTIANLRWRCIIL